MSLWTDFLGNRGRRPIHKWTHYFPIYERHFEPLRNRSVTFLEIGVGGGGSLQMWKRWLGPLAVVVGLDVRPECKGFEEDQIHVRIGEQKDISTLSALVDEFGPFDAIVDDGSHVMADVTASFDYLYPRMATSGVYLVEDMHTSYRRAYGGGLRQEGSFIEYSKALVDRLNAHHIRKGVDPDAFSDETWAMHFYDSVVVFERGPRRPRHAMHSDPS
ncbi:MAG: class I SAM-dependent methyltransferase [Thermoleophilaceae bacterium]|nr:class I SAM-dependent methyltransferase [Thermoleophilaceae bacterium]